jgi:hypothetical protein
MVDSRVLDVALIWAKLNDLSKALSCNWCDCKANRLLFGEGTIESFAINICRCIAITRNFGVSCASSGVCASSRSTMRLKERREGILRD